MNPDGTAFQTNPDGTIIQTLADRSRVEIPHNAIAYNEPYTPLQPTSQAGITTARLRIQEALVRWRRRFGVLRSCGVRVTQGAVATRQQ